jgi:hypothetical protein
LNAGLTQVLAYGDETYLYGLNRLGYDNSSETYQYLAGALGSERQVTKGGAGISVFDETCLSYPIFCFTRNIQKIHIKVVT